MVSSKRGSLGDAFGTHFCPIAPKAIFSGDPYDPLEADYNFEQNGFVQKEVLRGMPLGRIFDQSLQKQVFPDPCLIHFKPFTLLNKTVSSKRGSLGGSLWDAFFTNRSKSSFSGPPYIPL